MLIEKLIYFQATTARAGKQEVDDLVASLLGDNTVGGSRPPSSLSGRVVQEPGSRIPYGVPSRSSAIPHLKRSTSTETGGLTEQVKSSQSEFRLVIWAGSKTSNRG
jgi:hypothetical protein